MSEMNYVGTPTIVYQMPREAMLEVIREAQVSQIEESFLMPFTTTTICARTAAEILDVHYNTVLEYAKNGILQSEPRTYQGNNSHVHFNLAKVLKFRRDREVQKLK